MSRLLEVLTAYTGSDGEATRSLFGRLEGLGPVGLVAVNLFRAQKASERAKVYRRGFRGVAYDKKDWAIEQLCTALREHGTVLGLAWGWGTDPETPVYSDVLYVELPDGQVSFHTRARVPECPDHDRPWDGVKGHSPGRICRWIASLLETVSA